MPSHGRKRNRGNKSYDEDSTREQRQDESSYSHSRSSRQSDPHRPRSNSTRNNPNSYDISIREAPSSSRAVDYWQRSDYSSSAGGYQQQQQPQDRYHKGTVETEGWSAREDPYSHSHPQQREEWEWPPPPRYERPPVHSQQQWQEDVRHRDDRVAHEQLLQQNSRQESASRWQREQQSVREPYIQESDNGWATRHRRQSWNEPSTSRFRSPSPPPAPAPPSITRQWEPAPGWQSESQNHRPYHQQQQQQQPQQQTNGHRSISSHNKKSSKNGKKSYSNGKSNGNRRSWKEEDDLNNWSRRDEERHTSLSHRKHSRSFSPRSRSPADSYHSYRSRTPRRSPRPSPTYHDSPPPPPPKRRRRSSPILSPRGRSPDYGERGRSGWPSPSAERRSPVSSPHRKRAIKVVSSRRSPSPASVRSYRARSPTPANYARAPTSPQLSAPNSLPSVDVVPPDQLPQPEPVTVAQEPPPQPQQKGGKNKKKKKGKNSQAHAPQAALVPQTNAFVQPSPAQQIHPPPQFPNHNQYPFPYQYPSYYPYQIPPGVDMYGAQMPLPTTLTLPVPHTPQNISSLPERPPQPHPYSQMSHFPNGLPQNPNFIDTKSPSAPAPGSFVSIPTVKPPKTSLKRLYPAFSEDDDSAPAPVSNGPSSEAQPQPQAEPVKEEVDMTATILNPSSSTHAMNTPHFVPASNQLPSPGLSEPKLASKEPSTSPQVEEPSLVTPSPAFDALPTPPTSRPELYSIIGQVGEGTFGKVYKARNTLNNVHVALKRIRMESEKDGFPVTAMREIKLLQSLRHDNVVRLYEMMVSSGSVYMVFEYMDHDLTGVLSQTQFEFSEAHLKSLCQQMFRGLAYLHHKGVIHRDIKGSNILINNQGELKLADFGLARFYQKRRRADYTNRVITLWYRPPELLFGATVYGPEVDIWSAGCIMLELYTKKPVFQGNDEISQLEVIYRIVGTPTLQRWSGFANLPWYELVKPKDPIPNRFRDLFRKWMSPTALDLAERLLDYDPARRVTAAQALEAPYFLIDEPKPEKPTSLATLEGDWHELEAKRERAKKKKRE